MSSFQDYDFRLEILESIAALGFEIPTEIQAETIPFLLNSDQDLIALAQTGTGKTAGFGLPIIQRLDMEHNVIQALILSPTRELCMQIAKDLTSYAVKFKGFQVVSVYGGADIQPQIKKLRNNPQIVVGTPGRTLDLINRRALKVDSIQWLVMDEADEMLTMGFKDDLDAILASTPKEKQTMLFSATMPASIKELSSKYMKNTHEISVGTRNAGAENVNHEYYVVHSKDRYPALKRVVDLYPKIYAIVFCRTRAETKEVADKLMNDGYNADTLHGDLSQAQRDFVMNRFRQKHIQLLVATDVAARGLDVDDLTHVINYNLPDELEVYIHRSGRTGRAGKKGTSISIIHTREPRKIKALEKVTKKSFERKMVPNGQQICEKQLYNLIDKVERVEINEEEIAQFMDGIFKKLSWLDRDQLIKRFVSVEFNRFLAYYENAPDLNVQLSGRESRDDRYDGRTRAEKRDRTLRSSREDRSRTRDKKNDREERSGREGRSGRDGRSAGQKRGAFDFAKFYINLGTKDNLTPGKLLGLINERVKTKGIEIGQIEMMKKFAFFEIDDRYTDEIIASFDGLQWGSVRVNVELKTSKAPKKIRRKS
jgi:ATP-dependent RNA helicase DeaD